MNKRFINRGSSYPKEAMGFRGYLPVSYRSYYAITTWGPLMGPMLCTKESRYVRMRLRSTVYTRVQKTRSHAPRVAAFIAYTHPIRPSTVLSMLEETVTHEIQYFRYVTFEQAAAFTATNSPVVIPRLLLPKLFHRRGGGGYTAQLP